MKWQWVCFNVFCLAIIALTMSVDWGREAWSDTVTRSLIMTGIWAGSNLLLLLLRWRDALIARHQKSYQPRCWPPKIKII